MRVVTSHALVRMSQRVRARVTGSRSKGMPVLSAARQRGSSSASRQGAVTKGTPLRTVLSHPISPPTCQPGRESRRRAAKALSRH
eukprot:364768-Chlamydomonas_euryale.AAC.4